MNTLPSHHHRPDAALPVDHHPKSDIAAMNSAVFSEPPRLHPVQTPADQLGANHAVPTARLEHGVASLGTKRVRMPDRPSQRSAVDPSVQLVRADNVLLKAVSWLWNEYLPAGMLTLLGGAPGCAKTSLALNLAATVTIGGTWPDGSTCTDAGDVIVWSGEDGQNVLRARLMANGADMSRVFFVGSLVGCGEEMFDPSRHMPMLEAALAELPRPKLLIVDPIVSAVAGDGHRANVVRRSLQPLVEMAQRLNCAVLGITHFSKGTAKTDPTERITGSHAFSALARMVLVAAKAGSYDSKVTQYVLVRSKSNLGPDDGGFAYWLERVDVAPEVQGQCVRWGEALEGSASNILAAVQGNAAASPEESAVSEACKFLLEELQAGPKLAKYMTTEAKNAGHCERTLKRAKAAKGVRSRKLPNGWVWEMPALAAAEASAVMDATVLEDAQLGMVGTVGTVVERPNTPDPHGTATAGHQDCQQTAFAATEAE